jgi:integrase
MPGARVLRHPGVSWRTARTADTTAPSGSDVASDASAASLPLILQGFRIKAPECWPSWQPGGRRAHLHRRQGRPLRRSNFKMVAWPYAVRAIGAEGLHFHDLRHTGNHFAAASGASLKDLMAQIGHR